MEIFTGRDLQDIMVKNRKSLKVSAALLEITVQKLQSYFLRPDFEEGFIDKIKNTLDLYNVVSIPRAISNEALDEIERLRKIINLKQKIIEIQEETIKNQLEILCSLKK